MIVYLDQNKWIELARMVHGKDNSPMAKKIPLYALEAVKKGRIVFVLSAIHYIETARISNAGRRTRLAKVMWKYSQGNTITSYKNIVLHELASALSHFFNINRKMDFQLIGYGISHAFGEKFSINFPQHIENIFEECCLTGEGPNGEIMPGLHQTRYRESFLNHLNKLPSIREDLPKNKWEDCLYAICTMDIVEPLYEIMGAEGISPEQLGNIGPDNLRKLVDLMPTRQMDLFLHKLVLQNPNLKHQDTVLEDWAGLGVASQYCDLVICEKHFQDMTSRKGYKGKAKVTKDINVLMEL